MDNTSYLDKFLRNIGILTNDEQRRIQKKKVAVLGCGGGSDVARQLVASGFEQFLLADEDTVALHNLNRQFYTQEDVGINKAVALAKNLRRINPDIKIEIFKQMVTTASVVKIVRNYDIIIDAIPPDTALKEELVLAREVRKYPNKFQLYFMDIPWGAKVIVFSKESGTFEEFVGVPLNCDLPYVDMMTLQDKTRNFMVDASIETLRVGKMIYAGKLSYVPQMAVTVSLAASMVTTLCIFLSIGKRIKLAPHVFTFDYIKEFIVT